MISKYLYDFDKYFANYIDTLFRVDNNDNIEFNPVDDSDGIFVSRILWNLTNILPLQLNPDDTELILMVSDSVDELEVLGNISFFSAQEHEALNDICFTFLGAIEKWFSINKKEKSMLSHLEYLELLNNYKDLAISRMKIRLIDGKTKLKISSVEDTNTLNRTIETQNNMLKKIGRKVKYRLGRISKEKLLEIAFSTRKINGSINYTGIARELGYHPTTVQAEFVRRNIANKIFYPKT